MPRFRPARARHSAGTFTPLAAALLLALGGCGNDGAANNGAGDGAALPPDMTLLPDLAVTPEQACAAGVSAICKRLDECAPGLIKLAYGDLATCNTRLAINCKAGFTLAGTSADPARSLACAALLPSASCDDLIRSKLPGDCGTLPGMIADGLACAEDAQCKSTQCVKPTGGGCGTCGAAPKAGESCAKLACAPGLACGGNGVCTPYGAMGDSCDANHPCLPSLACKGSNRQGSCTTPLALNAGCDPLQGEYAGCALARGEYCEPGSRTCQLVMWSSGGGQCQLVNGKYVACAGAGHCTSTNILIPGSCLAPAADGAACDTAKGPDCLSPARCIGGVCKLLDPTSCK